MAKDFVHASDDLSPASEQEYGGGVELPTTGFLVFGLISFWIYTVWSYCWILENHLVSRLEYFTRLIEVSGLSEERQGAFKTIVRRGFGFSRAPKYLCTVLYLVCGIIVVFLFLYRSFSGELEYRLELVLVAVAALLFCSASMWFLLAASRTMKNHEYHELLLLGMAHDPEGFKMVQPSDKFVRRWNAHQTRIALFLVVTIPMTVSPILAVYHSYAILGGSLEHLDLIIFGWIVLLLLFAAVFHLWGSHILISMYNGHLRIEAVNRHRMSEVRAGKASALEASAGADAIPQRTLAAIMITDMVGFSKDMESREEKTYQKLLAHNELIRRHIEANRGEEIKTMGDAFLVQFKSAVDAVRAGIGIQSDFSRYNKDKPEPEKILVRIGIHIGDVLLVGKDVIGNGVNVASRIEPLADPGGICISGDVYNVVKKSIELQVLRLDKRELKNIRDSPDLYKIVVQSVVEARTE
ncbi:MAG: adenylate/guanylate cyclase domain-containing protein [Thermodesulfobacteriota bacterium]